VEPIEQLLGGSAMRRRQHGQRNIERRLAIESREPSRQPAVETGAAERVAKVLAGHEPNGIAVGEDGEGQGQTWSAMGHKVDARESRYEPEALATGFTRESVAYE